MCSEVFVCAGHLLAQLEVLADDGSAGDYGDALLPAFVADGGVVEHRHDGYWRDVGTIAAYHRAHMELVADDPPLRLDDPDWPLLTGSIIGGPAARRRRRRASGPLLSPGVVVQGTVERSVLGRDVVVEAGAVVRASVVLDGASVSTGAVVEQAIVDIAMTVDAHDRGEHDDSGITLFTHEQPDLGHVTQASGRTVCGSQVCGAPTSCQVGRSPIIVTSRDSQSPRPPSVAAGDATRAALLGGHCRP